MLKWSTAKNVLQFVFFIVLIFFLVQYLSSQWQRLQHELVQVDWGVFITAQLGMIVGMGLFPLSSWLTLRALKVDRSIPIVMRIFYLSGIAKYLPGSIWALPGRVFLYKRDEISTNIATAALLWEVALMVLSSLILSLLSVNVILYYVSSDIFIAFLITVFLICLLGLLIIFVANKQSLIPKSISRILSTLNIDTNYKFLIAALINFFLAWFVLGFSFFGMLYAIHPVISGDKVLVVIGIFAGSWVVGFLAIFAPGGLGVRDVLIGLALTTFMADPLPFVATVLSRIAWTVSEMTGVFVSLALVRLLHPVANRRDLLNSQQNPQNLS